MSYTQYGNIQATDFNTLVGTNPTAIANTLNAVWGTGSGSAGYGQSPLATVSSGNTVSANTQWANLISSVTTCGAHQGSSIIAATSPSAGSTVQYTAAIPTNLSTVYTNRLNAAAQGSNISNSVTTTATWSNTCTWTHTATFANGDAARYFFNSGGQIKIAMSHPTGSGLNATFNTLAANVGNVVQSSIASGTASINGNTYTGITKVGGGGTPTVYSTNSGYYAMTAANANVLYQTAVNGSNTASINLLVKSNGTQGSNADAGNTLTLYTVWHESPTGSIITSGSNVTVTAIYPESTYLSASPNAWGTVTLAGTYTAT